MEWCGGDSPGQDQDLVFKRRKLDDDKDQSGTDASAEPYNEGQAPKVTLYVGAKGTLHVWDADDVVLMQRTYHIMGTPVGCYPEAPLQDIFMSLPYRIHPAEAAYLRDKRAAIFLDESVLSTPPTPEQESAFLARRKEEIDENLRKSEIERIAQIDQRKEQIMSARRKKKQSPANSEDEEVLWQRIRAETIQRQLESITSVRVEFPFRSWRVEMGLCSLPVIPFEYPTTQQERVYYAAYSALVDAGFWLTSGSKYGGDLLLYEGDVHVNHSVCIVKIFPEDSPIPLDDVLRIGRVATSVHKAVLWASVRKDFTVDFTCNKWALLKIFCKLKRKLMALLELEDQYTEGQLGQGDSRSFGICDLPEEILYEIFFELESSHQHRLRRVSNVWLQALSSKRLQEIARVDISLPMAGLDPDFQFISLEDLPAQMLVVDRPSSSRKQAGLQLQRLHRLVSSHTKFLQLNWTDQSGDLNLLEMVVAWYYVYVFVSSVKKNRHRPQQSALATNVKLLLLDNVWAIDGFQNLLLSTCTRQKCEEPFRAYKETPICTVVLRRCRFVPVGRFVSFFNHPFQYQDCEFVNLPADCPNWIRVPLITLNFTNSSSEVVEDVLLSTVDHCYEVPSSAVSLLPLKVMGLPEEAKERLKRELIKFEPVYTEHKPENIDLETIEWSQLRVSSVLFTLCFRNLIQ